MKFTFTACKDCPHQTTSHYKCSAVPGMGDHLATIDVGRRGLLCPFGGGSWVPIYDLTQCGLGRGLPPYELSGILIQQLFGRNRHGPKMEGCCAFFGVGAEGKLGLHPRQCGRGRGIPPCHAKFHVVDPSKRLALGG